MLAGGAFSLSLGSIREVCPLDLSRRLAMEMTTRNTIILTNKRLAFMTHADNQSGVLSKSSRESIPGIAARPISTTMFAFLTTSWWDPRHRQTLTDSTLRHSTCFGHRTYMLTSATESGPDA